MGAAPHPGPDPPPVRLREGAQRPEAPAGAAAPQGGGKLSARGGIALALALLASPAAPLVAPPASSQSARATLVVLPFTLADNGYNADVAGMRARLERAGYSPERGMEEALAASGRYAIVRPARADGGAMDDSARGTPAPCEELACIARAGRAAGASRVVTGRITRVSDIIWFVSVALVDADAARLVHAEQSIEVKGDIADLIPKTMTALARRLVAHDTVAYRAAPAPDDTVPRRLSREEVVRRLAAATESTPADLRGADLSGLDLAGLDFKRADLTGCRLVGTKLARAKMFGVTLNHCVATRADLTGAVLDVAVLRGTDLTGATLRDASLYATILIGTNLTEADLTGARIIAAAQDARLPRAKLVGARMGADPGNQPMGVMRTDLTGADLAGADLSRADLRKANFTRADLTGASLAGADVTGADFTSAILRSLRGRAEILHLDRANNLDKAVGWEPR
ncbi:MAG TPA: pentapeptide repeat-containing protein [Gemmatimonadaceae bacterium]|nr:pentapeptide repeat-containing protein [Gemmatimonadaceae bacterium]